MEQTKRLECKHCGYSWTCNSKLANVSCPSCLGKTENMGALVSQNALDKKTQEVLDGIKDN